MRQFVEKLYDALKSVKLATALIALIAGVAVYGGLAEDGHAIFSSLLFLALCALFTINLTVCTFHRAARELSKPRKLRKHGPDILHVGLLILILGAVLTARTRTEDFFYLAKGQQTALPNGYTVALVDLSQELYPDGRPKSWKTIVAVEKSDVSPNNSSEEYDTLGETGYMGTLESGYRFAPGMTEPAASPYPPESLKEIRVNAPLKVAGYTLYLQDWETEYRAILADPMGIEAEVAQGGSIGAYDSGIRFMAAEETEAAGDAQDDAHAEDCSNHKGLFIVGSGSSREMVRAAPGDKVGDFTFVRFSESPVPGFKVVRDDLFPLVAVGLALVCIGLMLTYFSKIKGLIA